MAKAAARIGLIRRTLGQFRASHANYARALTAFRELGNRIDQCKVLAFLGVLSMYVGELKASELYFEDSLKLSQSLGLRHMALSTRSDLATLALQRGATPNVLKAYLDILTELRALGLRRFEAVALGNVGRFHAEAGDYDQATVYLEQAIERCGQHQFSVAAAAFRSTLSLVRAQAGDIDVALVDAQRAEAE